MARKTQQRSWSSAYLRLQTLHKIIRKSFHSAASMKCESVSTGSVCDDCASTSSLLDECISRICPDCISSVVIANPATLAGQQEGAILVIKSNTSCDLEDDDDIQPQVGDHVLVVSFRSAKQVIVKNLRPLHTRVPVPWANFFPVPYYGKCACLKGRCRCIYESEEAFFERCPQDRITSDADRNTNLDLESANPDTRRGQSVGAVLTIKQKPSYPSNISPILLTEVGDKIEVFRHFRKDSSKTSLVKGKNLRTGGEGMMGWQAFRAVGTRMMCGCAETKCDCVYEDFVASLEHKEKIGLAKWVECEAVPE